MSTRATSTAFSDFVLAGCSLYAALNVREVSGSAALGMVCVAIAASLGVLRFGVVLPNIQSKVIQLHKLLTWIVAVLGRISSTSCNELQNSIILRVTLCTFPREV